MADHVRVHVRYRPSKAGIAALAVGPEIRTAVTDVGQNGLDYAQLISPADSRRYINSFHLDVDVIPDWPNRQGGDPPMARWAATIVNDDPGAIAIEVGTASGPTRGGPRTGSRVLGRTGEWLELVADD